MKKTFEVEWKKDNGINTFGDYTHLGCDSERFDDGARRMTFYARDKDTRRELNLDEFQRACASFFFQNAHETHD